RCIGCGWPVEHGHVGCRRCEPAEYATDHTGCWYPMRRARWSAVEPGHVIVGRDGRLWMVNTIGPVDIHGRRDVTAVSGPHVVSYSRAAGDRVTLLVTPELAGHLRTLHELGPELIGQAEGAAREPGTDE
ncbi:MAG: hypothetical protein ACRCZP_14080, partial [Phycicoccus sp.]